MVRRLCSKTSVLFFSMFLLTLLALPSLAAEKVYSFTGAIGSDMKIQMGLTVQGDQVSGTYYYDKYKIDLTLKGTLTAQQDLVLEEYDSTGKNTGHFTGVFVSDTRVEGFWRTDGVQYPFELKETDSAGKVKPAGTRRPWVGIWRRTDDSPFNWADMLITQAAGNVITFEIWAGSGVHQGQLISTATVQGNQAEGSEKDTGERVRLMLDNDKLVVETDYCEVNGTFFAGLYLQGTEFRPEAGWTLVKRGILSETQDQAFRKLVGQDYELFLYSFHLARADQDPEIPEATVWHGFVRGLAGQEEAVIMITPGGTIWAAVLNYGEVKYYTNDPAYAAKLPKTIEQWYRELPGQARVLFMNAPQ